MNLFGEAEPTQQAYRVLARKYRPTVFEDLIGQDVLVRTLSNAIKTGRLAHAFLLTGIRGVGKTTTARLIARALNCIGEDGKGGPTIQPCGVCPNCKMIAEDRHMDVIEMDAASRTGVNDIRELIDTVQYAPTSARYKIYIIDEVHMLSNNAFNALLKTLEEPPPHVKFIFATTELRKIPVTILSRCQTFDLKRVEGDELVKHLSNIAGKEGVSVEDAALRLIANAAEGSVRDSLSLLDQAIAHGTGEDGVIAVKADMVRAMLGMADRSRSFRLLEQLMEGDAKTALGTFKEQYHDGADPAYILQELMELIHLVTRIKLVPDLIHSAELTEQERNHGKNMAEKLAVSHLTRGWQILSKGLQEARLAPNPYIAAEMVFIRLMHASTLPTPAEIVRTLQENGTLEAAKNAAPSVPVAHTPRAPQTTSSYSAPQNAPVASSRMQPVSQLAPMEAVPAQAEPVMSVMPSPQTYEEVAKLFEANRELYLYSFLYENVRPVSFEMGKIEVQPEASVPSDFAGKVGKLLTQWTGKRWVVIISAGPGLQTMKEKANLRMQDKLATASQHPLVRSVMEVFEGAKITALQEALHTEVAEVESAAETIEE